MERNRGIEGIFEMPNGDIFVQGWVSVLIPKKDFGGVELMPVSELSSPCLGTNGDDKWYIFSPHNLLGLSQAPSAEEMAGAEILPPPSVH
ncbi:MAG: hypothetical protein PHC97_03385 [Patescibacteria group bacterium]|nr:hypothetical protein [Patescibacteria group bacterium]